MRRTPTPSRGAKVFIDTGAYGAITLFDDGHHQIAVATLRHLTEHGWGFFTTNFVVAEMHALILSRSWSGAGARGGPAHR